MHRRLICLAIVAGIPAHLACGEVIAPPPPGLSITSHVNNQRIVGSRQVTLEGLLYQSGTIAQVAVTVSGGSVAATFGETQFSVPVTLGNNANVIAVTVTNNTGNDYSASLTLHYPFLNFSTFEPASRVVGQSDFTGRAPGAPSASTFGNIYGNPALINGVLYLPDYARNRVLGFAGIPSTNGAAADFVLGQASFTDGASASGADRMNGPQTLQEAGGKFFVTDYGNARILVWNSVPTATQTPAAYAIGQADLSESAGACSPTRLNGPESHIVVNGRLIVADSGNNRVLVYNSVPNSSGAAANLVLGQGDFTHCAINDDNQDGTEDTSPSARTLNYPGGVWSDGTRLVVADASNNRVLIWNEFPTTHFEPADVVLGQPDMTSNGSGATAVNFSFPFSIESNGNQLFVADASNHRIFVYNGWPNGSGTPPAAVLGQSNFTRSAFYDDNQDGTSDTNASARTLGDPSGMRILDDALWVADRGAYRWLAFRPANP